MRRKPKINQDRNCSHLWNEGWATLAIEPPPMVPALHMYTLRQAAEAHSLDLCQYMSMPTSAG